MAIIPTAQLLKELLPGLQSAFQMANIEDEEKRMEVKYPVRVSYFEDKWSVFHSGKSQRFDIVYPSFEDLPVWIQEKVNVLQVADKGTEIEGLGMKSVLLDRFYLAEDK